MFSTSFSTADELQTVSDDSHKTQKVQQLIAFRNYEMYNCVVNGEQSDSDVSRE